MSPGAPVIVTHLAGIIFGGCTRYKYASPEYACPAINNNRATQLRDAMIADNTCFADFRLALGREERDEVATLRCAMLQASLLPERTWTFRLFAV